MNYPEKRILMDKISTFLKKIYPKSKIKFGESSIIVNIGLSASLVGFKSKIIDFLTIDEISMLI